MLRGEYTKVCPVCRVRYRAEMHVCPRCGSRLVEVEEATGSPGTP